MASLNFKGKSAVWNHHLSVPYHTLERDAKKSLKGTNDSDNLIIEGDNLLALKSLLPLYQGKVQCIYIDPPYNTGNENWKYSDNVNSPTIQEWVGATVGKDDLTRHDKWLCMMTPRLKLLRELLASDGLIFASVDSNEMHHLRCLMDEVFGEDNYVGDFQWKKKSTSTNVEGAQVSSLTDYTLCFSKTSEGKIKPRVKLASTRAYPLNDKEGNYRLAIIEKKNAGAYERGTMTFAILGQKPRDGKRWQIGAELAKELEAKGRLVLDEGVVKRKIYDFEDKDTTSAQPMLLVLEDVGTTQTAGDLLAELFGEQEVFDNPKPIELVQHLIELSADENAIVLDSFAGSGTTAHAVLALNKEKKTNRKFILVEMEDYANDTTAQRVRHAIKKSSYGAGFTYNALGPAIDAETLLGGKLPAYTEFAKYVYYLATGKNHPKESEIKEASSFVGKAEHESIYLVYKQDMDALKKLAITLDWAQKAHDKDKGKKVVYAPACYLDDEALEQYNIKFVSIPYNLFERSA